MKGIKKCNRCGNKILSDQLADMLKTFRGEETIRTDYWHHDCYLLWLSENIESKAMGIFNKSMSVTMNKLAPVLQNVISNANAQD